MFETDRIVAGRPQLLRAMNEQTLLNAIRRHGPLARGDLTSLSGLSKPTVGLALANLERDGLVRAAGNRRGSRGPRAQLYEVRPDAGYVLALDVGSEYVRGAVSDLAGTVLARGNRSVHAASSHLRTSGLISLGDDLLAEAGVRPAKITQTIIGSPGFYNPVTDIVELANNLPGWEQPGVILDIREAFGQATAIQNDVNLSALAESRLGHGRGVDSFAFLSVGTGMAMGLVIGGQIYPGAHFAAGEIGYLPVVRSPGPAGTGAGAGAGAGGASGGADGARGAQPANGAGTPPVRQPSTLSRRRRSPPPTLESEASGPGVVRAARAAGLRGSPSARKVFEAARGGDLIAKSVVAAEARLVSYAIAAVAAVVDPALVVLGGGIGRAEGFAEIVARELRGMFPIVPEIRVTALGEEAVVEGAVVAGIDLAWEKLVDRG